MSSILIQYATASPISGDSVGTLSNVRTSIPKGGSASAAAAASGDATPRMRSEASRCGFFEGGEAMAAARARLAILGSGKEEGRHTRDREESGVAQDREMRFVASMWPHIYVTALSIWWAALHSWHDDQPRLNLRGTVITGKRLHPSNLDFFGGLYFLLIT